MVGNPERPAAAHAMRSYEIAARWIVRKLGHVGLQALTPLQVEGFYADLARPDNAGRALAPKSIRNIHIVLRKALADAERLGQVSRNAAAIAKAPALRRHEYSTWSSEDVQDFFSPASDHRLLAAFVLLATTGMRSSACDGRTSIWTAASWRWSRRLPPSATTSL